MTQRKTFKVCTCSHPKAWHEDDGKGRCKHCGAGELGCHKYKARGLGGGRRVTLAPPATGLLDTSAAMMTPAIVDARLILDVQRNASAFVAIATDLTRACAELSKSLARLVAGASIEARTFGELDRAVSSPAPASVVYRPDRPDVDVDDKARTVTARGDVASMVQATRAVEEMQQRRPGPVSLVVDNTRGDVAEPWRPGELAIGPERILTAIAQRPRGVIGRQLATLCGFKRSTRNTYLRRLVAARYVYTEGGRFIATTRGLRYLGPEFKPLPVGAKLREHWIESLPEGEGAIFELVVEAYPASVERDEIRMRTSFARSTANTYLARLKQRELVTFAGKSGAVRASADLFEEGT